jgi:hypothetical protein
VINWILFERHTVTRGEFHGFEINTSKDIALRNISALGIKKVENLKNGQVCTISTSNWHPQPPYDLWQFYDSSVHPNGATYCMYFKNDRLIRIDYLRERVQVE